MREINILEKSHPTMKREAKNDWRSEENKEIAKRYDEDFFDGDRINGYGGYFYDGRWRHVVKAMQKLYGINRNSAILDIGCAKGFLLFDLQDMIPGIKVAGLDISDYALNKSMDGYGKFITKNNSNSYSWESGTIEKRAQNKVQPFMIKDSAENLLWPDNTFDVIISINTLHNLSRNKCKKAIEEIMRVSKPNGNKFITVDAYRNEEEKQKMKNWVLTAETVMSTEEWTDFFEKAGYDGDYYWFIA